MMEWFSGKQKRAITGGPAVATAGKKPFGINVNWPVENRWVRPSQEVATTTSISSYKLKQKVNGSFYKYTLDFTCSMHYDYYF